MVVSCRQRPYLHRKATDDELLSVTSYVPAIIQAKNDVVPPPPPPRKKKQAFTQKLKRLCTIIYQNEQEQLRFEKKKLCTNDKIQKPILACNSKFSYLKTI